MKTCLDIETANSIRIINAQLYSYHWPEKRIMIIVGIKHTGTKQEIQITCKYTVLTKAREGVFIYRYLSYTSNS